MKNLRSVWGVVLLAAGLFLSGCGQAGGKINLAASVADDLYAQAEALAGEGKKLEAKSVLQQILGEHSDYKNIETVQEALYRINMEILFSNIQTPDTIMHEVVAGDTLGKISSQYNETKDLIRVSNKLSGDTVRMGQRLRIWNGKFSVHVDKSQNVLILKNGEEVWRVYHVSTGANNSTPVGTFKITTKLENPVWFKAGAVIPPESPDNVLGTRWLGFDIEGYGIHGTVEPDKIGQQVTAGCVRMRNNEVEELYKILPKNTQVTIVD